VLLPRHEFLKPATLAEGLAALRSASGEVKLLGGGTDVVFNMRGRLMQPDVLLSLKDLPELQGVEWLADGTLRLGAGCRLSDLDRDAQITERYPALARAFGAVASRHVRNMATLGGNLCLDTRCWYTNQTAEWREAKGPCLKTGVNACHALRNSEICVALNNSDVAPALIAMDAVVTLQSADGERFVHLEDFYTDDGIAHTVRRADEILTSVAVPPMRSRMVYLKETARKGNDFAYGTIAARADGEGEHAPHVKLVIGSLTTKPVVLVAPAAIVAAQGLTDDAIRQAVADTRGELGALTNLYTPATYKSKLAKSMLRQALSRLREL